MESLASTSVPHEVFYGEEANRRYPRELQLSAKTKCIFEEDGGILFASKALAAFQVCTYIRHISSVQIGNVCSLEIVLRVCYTNAFQSPDCVMKTCNLEIA